MTFRNENRSGVPRTLLIALCLLAMAPAWAAEGFDDENAEEEPDVRERVVGKSYLLEQKLETDRSLDTWLYVCSAVIVLCIGWICFKPTRIYVPNKEKRRKKKDKSAKKNGK